MKYGQFCPIAKATEVLGERWSVLIVRELLMGGRRFSELQRGLGDISPALLTARLKSFAAEGLVVKRRISGQRGLNIIRPYREALLPVVIAMRVGTVLGARQVDPGRFRHRFRCYHRAVHRSVPLPGDHTVIQFKFKDLAEHADWWLLVDGDNVDVCITRPGRDVDLFFTTSARTMRRRVDGRPNLSRGNSGGRPYR